MHPPFYDSVQSLRLHNSLLCSSSRDRSLKFWDLGTMALTHAVPNAHHDWIMDTLVFGQGTRVVTAGRDGVLKLWGGGDQWECVDEVAAHKHAVNALAMDAAGRIFSASSDRTIKVWKVD